MKKIMSMIMAAMVFLTIGTGYVQAQDKTSDSASELPKVYLIKEITPENLVKIYERSRSDERHHMQHAHGVFAYAGTHYAVPQGFA